MNPNKRIFLNVMATYGRSLYALVVGLFTSRWVLMSLGQVDFGLYGVVGGLTVFIEFFNNIMSMAVVRFYAVTVGAANLQSQTEGVNECRRWFSIAVFLHTIVPISLMLLGYPVGEWAVKHFLNIPTERIYICVWVWRFTCFSCIISMINVPFKAMYTAKQEIAELTIYSFVTTTLNVCFLYYIVSHPSDWLMRYAAWMCMISVLPQIIIGVRAYFKYTECRFVQKYVFCWSYIKELLFYACSRFWTAFSDIFSSQGLNVLVNKKLGPAFNASMSVGNQVASQSSTLSSSISGAFWPAIANAAGEGNTKKVKKLCFRVCRLSTLMVLVFFIPLSLEMDSVLHLWLKTPPDFATELCLSIMFDVFCERITEGYWMAILGVGKRIGYYSWVIGWVGFSRFLFAFVFFVWGMKLYSICIAFLLAGMVRICFRLYLGKTIVNLSVAYWSMKVMLPIMFCSMFGLLGGLPCRVLMSASIYRIALTSICSLLVALPIAWRFALFEDEKKIVLTKILVFFSHVIGKRKLVDIDA